MSAFARALRILDEIQNLAQLERFDPAVFVAAIGGEAAPPGETLPDLAGQLDAARGLLGEIDRFAQKDMRIRLIHLSDRLPQPLRTLLGATIVSYDSDRALLRDRVAAMLARLDRSTAAELTERVMEAAERVLAARAALRRGVLELAQRIGAAWLPAAKRAARDRSQADDERDRWARARVDLERLGTRGETLDGGSFAERLARIAPPADEPEEPDDPVAKRFSLLEID